MSIQLEWNKNQVSIGGLALKKATWFHSIKLTDNRYIKRADVHVVEGIDGSVRDGRYCANPQGLAIVITGHRRGSSVIGGDRLCPRRNDIGTICAGRYLKIAWAGSEGRVLHIWKIRNKKDARTNDKT